MVRKKREREPAEQAAPPRERPGASGGPNVADVRAKSSGHGKKTADKWNQ